MRFGVLILAFLFFSGPESASADSPIQYVTASELASNLRGQTPMLIVDLRVPEEFARGRIIGSITADSYPLVTEGQYRRLETLVPRLMAGDAPIVLVCPRGGGCARRAQAHLVRKGIGAKRLFILYKGWTGWNYPELTEGR